MKPNKLKLFVSTAVAGVLACGSIAQAQYSPAPPPAPPASGGDTNAAQTRAARSAALQAMLANFSLTAEQKIQIKDALKTQRDKIMALRQDPTVTDANHMDKIREIMDGTDATLKKVFTPEQFKKWQEATKDMRPPSTQSATNSVPAPKPAEPGKN